MLLEYIDTAMRKAKYEILKDDRSIYGYIPGFRGVYSNASNLENCRKELHEVLEEWILLRLQRKLPIPILKRINLNIRKPAACHL